VGVGDGVGELGESGGGVGALTATLAFVEVVSVRNISTKY
jgi:hypothetical protein